MSVISCTRYQGQASGITAGSLVVSRFGDHASFYNNCSDEAIVLLEAGQDGQRIPIYLPHAQVLALACELRLIADERPGNAT